MNLEARLRDALRPVDPSPGFAARVRARVERERHAGRPGGGASTPGWRSWLATAAAVAILAAGGYGYRQYEERRDALAARSQVLLALQITSRALETVHRQVVHADDNTEAASRDGAADQGETR